MCFGEINAFHKFFREVQAAQRSFIEKLTQKKPNRCKAAASRRTLDVEKSTADASSNGLNDDFSGSYTSGDAVESPLFIKEEELEIIDEHSGI